MSLVYNCSYSLNFEAFFPLIMWSKVGKSFAYLHIGPITKYRRNNSSPELGKCPSTETTPPVGLWPKMPLNCAGIRIDPAAKKRIITTIILDQLVTQNNIRHSLQITLLPTELWSLWGGFEKFLWNIVICYCSIENAV